MTCAMASIAALEGRLARLAACALGEHGAGQEEGEEKDRYLYAIGGCDVMEEELDRVERYDLVSGEWETLSGMGERRWCSGAAVVRDRVCVAGGGEWWLHISEQLHDVRRHGGHVVCPARDEQGAQYSHGLVSVDDCHLYAFGGLGLSCVERLDMGSVLDGVGSVKWIMCPGVMLNPSGSEGRCAFGYCSISGSGEDRDDTYIYCIGGWAAGDLNDRDVQRYSVRRGEWEPLAPLPDKRWCPSVICVRDSEEEGRRVIAVVGGRWW